MATQRHAPRARRLTAHRTPADSIFLAHGANVNVRDESGWRPLHYAALCRSQRVLRLLLASRSVDVDAPNDLGWRPLDMCATVEDARALLDAGAVFTASPGSPLPTLHHAAYNSRLEVLTELLARGADVHHVISYDDARLSYSLEFGGTALHCAAAALCCACTVRENTRGAFPILAPEMVDAGLASARRVAVVEALLAAGADVNNIPPPPRASSPSVTPLIMAAYHGDSVVITALLRAGANAEVFEAATGYNALLYAAHHGHTDAVYALVAGGADVNRSAPDDAELQPLICAVLGNRHGTVRALLELGANTTYVATVLALPPATFLPQVFDATTRELVARHLSGRSRPARACALPACEARRRVDYDDKKLMACPCKARA